MNRSEYIKVFTLRVIGNFLLLSACAGVFLTFAPAIQAEAKFRYDEILGVKYVVSDDKEQGSFGNIYQGLEPKSRDFGVVITRIGANANVIPNVDPGNEREYMEALQEGVAHAAGSVMPGEKGNSVLFAHSVGNFWEVNQWNAVFYLLKELEPGDTIDVFYKDKRYVYEVYDKTIVDPDQVEFLRPEADFQKLTLETCWPPGTTLKRLLVFAKLKD